MKLKFIVITPLMLVLIVAAFAPAIMQVLQLSVDTSVSHAVTKHQIAGQKVRDFCTTNEDATKLFFIKQTKQVMQTCLLEEMVDGGKVGFRLLQKFADGWKEITAYVKDTLVDQSWDGIKAWANDHGWIEMSQDELP